MWCAARDPESAELAREKPKHAPHPVGSTLCVLGPAGAKVGGRERPSRRPSPLTDPYAAPPPSRHTATLPADGPSHRAISRAASMQPPLALTSHRNPCTPAPDGPSQVGLLEHFSRSLHPFLEEMRQALAREEDARAALLQAEIQAEEYEAVAE
eukprot:2744457-Prymnesium_polylepis.1